MKKILKKFTILPIILVSAIMIVVILVKTKSPAEHEEKGYPQKAVEVITAKKIPFRASAMAFGHVEPAVLLKAKSEVSGKIVYIHPNLEKGASIDQGTIVLRIEPTTFEISLNQSTAALAGSQSALTQLLVEEKSTKSALVIAQKKLAVQQKELDRMQQLIVKGTISQSALDREEQAVLSQRQQIQDIQGKLSSFDSRRAAINAQIKQSESLVNKSKDTLGRTEVSMPFDARIGTVQVEEGEFVQAGGTLFEALGVQAVEINARLPLNQFRNLISGLFDLHDNPSISLASASSLQVALGKMQLEARVRLVGNSSEPSIWEGKLIRLSESVDPIRDTLGLVIAVNDPYEGVIPGVRPPLLKGMYTSVELFSPARLALVLPRKAVHQGRVYVAEADDTLSIRTLDILFTQGNLVVVADTENAGINVGERVIISDVIPVMDGLPLKVIPADEYEIQLARLAVGARE
ncbi:MAG: HlyD family secretion protein [Proteobacteria bacterium]|nr:HlyD family secretion protein [Pseudomonadota bacterium]